MHTLKIEVKDSAFDKVKYLLSNLPADDVKVVSDFKEPERLGKSIDFSKYNVQSFKDIDDPVQWQKNLREEWDR